MRNSKCAMELEAPISHFAFPISPLEQCSLTPIRSRHPMTMPTPRLVRLATSHHDRRTIPGSRLVVDQPLIARRGTAADDADRLKLVHDLSDAHERRHGAERESTKVYVCARQDHAHALIGKTVGEIDDAVVEKLRLIDRQHFRLLPKPAADFLGGIDGLRFYGDAIVRGDGVESGVACI